MKKNNKSKCKEYRNKFLRSMIETKENMVRKLRREKMLRVIKIMVINL